MNRTAIVTGVGVIVVGAALTALFTGDDAPAPAEDEISSAQASAPETETAEAAITAPAAAQSTEMDDDAFGERVRAYLLQNPEVIFEAAAVMEQRQQELQSANDTDLIQQHADALFSDENSWVGGNPEGDVTIVEFMDYRCGYCRRAFPEVEELIASDGNIRLIVKEFPILGEQSTVASRFAIATLQQLGSDAYKAVHDAMMTYKGDMAVPALAGLADDLGLDAEAITAHMDDDSVTQVIDENRALGQALQISGTPSFVMQDQILRGYIPLEGMQEIVEDVRG
ncbi:Protein-disulfide isomerase [Roseovarius nanhaiticus]|uniref:Protein-disulfide isomerase n=1 Tax=Roseovarius nanhaiticus TaxID=573024 RepID=A0A1N7HH98_9RHOB|nr:DsbA family protein [Roseovarius nanhaiticus]SEK94163.1 Protein-disulfide isomerase [Roseovarius nanhaiticus]SIS24275.1 Protein-disulfide isomerase [Roseovarius nanhaiticus]